MSAFLLGGPYWSKTPQELFSWSLWGTYFLRRFQRIIPLYAITLLTLHELHQPLSSSVHSLPPHKIMEWLLMRDGEIQFWTIPVEVKFYFLLPLIILVFVGLSRQHIAVGILGMLCLVAALIYLLLPLDNLWSLRMPVRIWHCLPVFLLGLTAGAIHARIQRQKATPKWFAWSCEVLAVACFSIALLPLHFPIIPKLFSDIGTVLTDVFGVTCFYGVLSALFLFSHLHGIGLARTLFAWQPLRWLGFISFSTYLTHKAVMINMRPILFFGHTQWLPCCLAIITVGSLVCVLLEQPISKFRFSPTRPNASPSPKIVSLAPEN